MRRINVLGISLLLLGATLSFADDYEPEDELDSIEVIADAIDFDNTWAMTPAERESGSTQTEGAGQDVLSSPRTKAQSKMFATPDHEETYRTLSPKNRGVFDSLSKKDQQKVVNGYLNGEDPQKILMKILQKDQQMYNKERDGSEDGGGNRDTPASRSMQSPKRQSETGPESEVFESGME